MSDLWNFQDSRPSNGYELWSLSCKQFMYMNKDKTTIYIITKQKWGEWENRRTDFWLLMKMLCMEKNLDICSSYNTHVFRNLRKQFLTCRSWHSQNALRTMVHCQAFCIFRRQPPSRRHTLFATWRRTVQPLHCMFSHLLNSIVIFIPCTYMI